MTGRSRYQSKCLDALINIRMEQDQYKYLYDQEKKINKVMVDYQIMVKFYKLDVNMWN